MANRNLGDALSRAADMVASDALPPISEVIVTGNGTVRTTIHIHLTPGTAVEMNHDITLITVACGAQGWQARSGRAEKTAHGITVVVYVPDDLPPEVAHRARSLGWPSQTRLKSVT